VFCTKPRRGRLDGNVKIREACKPGEVAIDPEALGLCCPVATTTTVPSGSTSTTTTLPPSGCRSLETFTASAVPAIQANQCLSCHTTGNAQAALDLSGLVRTPRDDSHACDAALAHAGLANAAASPIILAPRGIIPHPFQGASQSYVTQMLAWIGAEAALTPPTTTTSTTSTTTTTLAAALCQALAAFSTHVVPEMLANQCLGCHTEGNAQAALDLSPLATGPRNDAQACDAALAHVNFMNPAASPLIEAPRGRIPHPFSGAPQVYESAVLIWIAAEQGG
jgi:hypothetical protein